MTEQRVGAGFEAPGAVELRLPRRGDSVMVSIEDANRHHEYARQRGARILEPPTDQPHGERQYTAEDLAGRRWTFSQSIADVAPEEWGGASSRIE